MDREIILAALACLLCGPALLIAGSIPLRLRPLESARRLELHTWRRLWLPVLPAALVLAFLIGWAIQEPEAAEAAGPVVFALAALFAWIWLRAAWRAARSLRAPAPRTVALTAGLVRPRVFVAPDLADQLDDRALHAALEHEAAHVRHRDPLRLWLAQIATDLQWPSAAARRRFADWRNALELARDAEACERCEGSDLAAALIEAVRLSGADHGHATVGLVNDAGGAGAFSDRIHRLLDEPPAAAPPVRAWTMWAVLVPAVALAFAAGVVYGEAVISWLPGLAA